MHLHERLQFHRKRAGLTQEEAAAQLSVTRQAVSKWETGAARPDLETLARLAEIYGVSLTVLTRGSPEEGPWLPPDSLRWQPEVRPRRPQAVATLGGLSWGCGALGALLALLALAVLISSRRLEVSLLGMSALAFLSAAGCRAARDGLEALYLDACAQAEDLERRFRLLREQQKDNPPV